MVTEALNPMSAKLRLQPIEEEALTETTVEDDEAAFRELSAAYARNQIERDNLKTRIMELSSGLKAKRRKRSRSALDQFITPVTFLSIAEAERPTRHDYGVSFRETTRYEHLAQVYLAKLREEKGINV